MLKASQCSVKNSNFAGNNATGYGGWVIRSDKCTLTDCSFTKNSAQNQGVVLAFDAIIERCNFTENSARSYAVIYCNNIALKDSNFTANSAYRGAVYSSGGDVAVTNSIFTNNTADYGGVIYLENANTVNIDGCVFFNNSAIYSVSDIVWGTDDVRTTITILNTNITASKSCEAIEPF